jgi:hypothetical protein
MTEQEAGTDRVSWEGPDSHLFFRLGQLQLLLVVADSLELSVKSIDRLAYYDFFAANPYAMLDGANPDRDTHDRLSLQLAGFKEGQLSYSAIGHRFANRRSRIRHDLALLVAYGLAKVEPDRYGPSEKGRKLVEELSTVYADAYRAGAEIALSRLVRLSDRRLTEKTEEWLGKSWLLLDFLDDVKEVELMNDISTANDA